VTTEHKNDDQQFKTLMIPVVIVNGVVGGLVSVVTSYFFKPVWEKIMSRWDK
jgi:hypothetical protein